MRLPILLLLSVIATSFSAMFVAFPAHSQVAPGFDVSVYTPISDPVSLSFSPSGDLYVGRDLIGSGGLPNDPTRIRRVLVGGSSVVDFGGTLDDPDAVLFDAAGLIAPNPNSVLVGAQLNTTTGVISAIAADGGTGAVIGPSSAFVNPSDMLFDGSGRLLFTDFQNRAVRVTTGGTPTTLFTISSDILGIAYDATTDTVYTTGADNVVRAHASDGTLLDATFANGGRAIAVGSGIAGFGSPLYTVNNTTGELLEVDGLGNTQVIGTGFVSVFDLAFGLDGALYASEFDNDRILRIAPAPIVPALDRLGLALTTLLLSFIGLASIYSTPPNRGDLRPPIS